MEKFLQGSSEDKGLGDCACRDDIFCMAFDFERKGK